MSINDVNELFYNSLSENQKKKVEEKVNEILTNTKADLSEGQVTSMRFQIASDMFKLLND